MPASQLIRLIWDRALTLLMIAVTFMLYVYLEVAFYYYQSEPRPLADYSALESFGGMDRKDKKNNFPNF